MSRGFKAGTLTCLMLLAGTWGAWAYRNRPAYLLRRGREALDRADAEEVARIAEVLDRRGYRQHRRLLRGEALLRQGLAQEERAAARDAFRQALAEFAQVRADGPLATDAAVAGAECLVRLGERTFAAEALNTVVKGHPDHKDAHRWLAAIYIDLKSPFEAIKQLNEWARLDPENGLPHRWAGSFYREVNNPNRAVEAYREALARRLPAEQRAVVVKEWAETLIEGLNDYVAADALLVQSLDEFRDGPDGLALRASCAWGLGKPDEAVTLAEQALRQDAGQTLALRLRAQIHLAHAEPRAALPLLDRAMRLAPDDVRVRQQLVQACVQAGDEKRAEHERQRLLETTRARDALGELIQAAASRPWDDVVRCQVAEQWRKLGRPAEARPWYEAALACNPANRTARDALEHLARE